MFIRHRLDAVDIAKVVASIEADANGKEGGSGNAGDPASAGGQSSEQAEELLAFFERVESIRRFGSEELGLNVGNSYSKYVEVEQDYLVAVVNATAPHSLSPYTWNYLLIGNAPYRGYYNPNGAMREAERLRAKGYEVWIRRVDAFSSLGFTSDPLFSFMQGYSELRLAQLIIHEQIHATLWVNNAVQFNEELAGSLDRFAALEYLRAQYGAGSEELRSAEASIADSGQYLSDLRQLAGEIQQYMSGWDFAGEALPLEIYPPEFTSGKQAVIASFKRRFAEAYAENYRSEDYRFFTEFDVNNAYLSLFQTYSERGDLYDALYYKYGSVRETLAAVQRALASPRQFGIDYTRGDDPIVIIEGLLAYTSE